MIPKEYASFFEGFVQLVKACGFAPHDAQSMTRELEGSHEQLTLWIHPRQPGLLHAHVKTSRSPHAVHLRLFDPHWKPERVLPGHLGKGFDISNPQQLKETALLLEELWPRIEHWFSNPISGEALMLQQGVAPFNVNQDEPRASSAARSSGSRRTGAKRRPALSAKSSLGYRRF